MISVMFACWAPSPTMLISSRSAHHTNSLCAHANSLKNCILHSILICTYIHNVWGHWWMSYHGAGRDSSHQEILNWDILLKENSIMYPNELMMVIFFLFTHKSNSSVLTYLILQLTGTLRFTHEGLKWQINWRLYIKSTHSNTKYKS